MTHRSKNIVFGILAALLGGQLVLVAADQQGQVRFGEVPVHGASVQATQGETTRRVLTDPQGRYVLSDLTDGSWTIQVEMPGFETVRRDVAVGKDAAAAEWSLKMLPLAEIRGEKSTGFPTVDPTASFALSGETPSAIDGLLINGSVVNGAATNLGLQRAFGNNRQTRPSPYRGQAQLSGGSSFFDARPVLDHGSGCAAAIVWADAGVVHHRWSVADSGTVSPR